MKFLLVLFAVTLDAALGIIVYAAALPIFGTFVSPMIGVVASLLAGVCVILMYMAWHDATSHS